MSGLVQGILSFNGRVYATLNPSDKGTNGTLSSGSLVYTGTVGQQGICRSTISKSTDKWYWEITLTNSTSQIPKIGIAQGTGVNLNSSLGAGNSYGYRGSPWCVTGMSGTQNGAGLCSSQVNGQVIGVALNLIDNRLRFYVEGSSIATLITLTPGSTWFAAVGIDGGSSVVTCNFGQNSWSPLTAGVRATLLSEGFNMGLY